MGHDGGCLCGELRYRVNAEPIRVTICYCRFCQRATGSAGMIEPIFPLDSYEVLSGEETIYSLISAGSGKRVDVHFCQRCGTKVRLTFERFPDMLGIYNGTFDDPDWIERHPDKTKHIFLGVAQRGTLIPAGFNCFEEHATTNSGEPIEPVRYEAPHLIC